MAQVFCRLCCASFFMRGVNGSCGIRGSKMDKTPTQAWSHGSGAKPVQGHIMTYNQPTQMRRSEK